MQKNRRARIGIMTSENTVDWVEQQGRLGRVYRLILNYTPPEAAPTEKAANPSDQMQAHGAPQTEGQS
jgi:hypothetical protein